MSATFSNRIKELRNNQELNQAEFAKLINTNQSTLSAYENGDRFPPYETLLCISKECHVSLDWLCGLSDTVSPNAELKTYTDIIKLIFKMEDANIDGFSCSTYNNAYSVCVGEIEISDESLISFFNEWKKMKEVHDNKIIDDEVYGLWIEKTLKKYDRPIQHSGFMHIPDNLGELPFN